MGSFTWIDVTVPLREGMTTWPGETEPRVYRSKRIDPDGVNVTELVLGAHTGTHVDAPIHFLSEGAGVESLSLAVLMGPCRVATIDTDGAIEPHDLAVAVTDGCERLLLRTKNRESWGATAQEFRADFIGLSEAGARWLIWRGIRLLGIDYLSVQPFSDPTPVVHTSLLMAGIHIVEGLDLNKVSDGDYELICLPLLVPGADGAPCRVLIRPS